MVAESLAQKLAIKMKNHKTRSSSAKLEEPPSKKKRSANNVLHDIKDSLADPNAISNFANEEVHQLPKTTRSSRRVKRAADNSVKNSSMLEINNNTNNNVSKIHSKKTKQKIKAHKGEDEDSIPSDQEHASKSSGKEKSQIKSKSQSSAENSLAAGSSDVPDESSKPLRKSAARSSQKHGKVELNKDAEGNGEKIKGQIITRKRRVSKRTSYKEPNTSEESSGENSDEDSDYSAPVEAQSAASSQEESDDDQNIAPRPSKRKNTKVSQPKSNKLKSKSSATQKAANTIAVKSGTGKVETKVSLKGKALKNSMTKVKENAARSNSGVVKGDDAGSNMAGKSISGAVERDSSSDDDSSDWEEVKDLPMEMLQRKDVQITLDGPKKKKKGCDWFEYSKMLWRRYMKYQHEYTHKVELMCLFTHGQLVNGRCNDPLLKALVLSIYGKTTLKGKQSTSANVSSVLSTLKTKVSLQAKLLSQQSISCVTLVDNLVQGLHSGVLHRADEFVLLMLSTLRALGAIARLCMAWYPVPVRISHYQKQQQLAKCSSTDKKSKIKSNSFMFSADKVGDVDQQVWLEVYDVVAQKWLTIDSNGEVVDDMTAIEEHLSKPVTYIVSYDNVGKFKDITQKYDSKWMTGTKKLRVNEEWWAETTKPYRAKECKKSKQEDQQLQNNLEQMPFPSTIGGFKDHPLYVLERHLLKFEAIYPRTSVPLGYTKTKEVIYSRSCVHTLHAREQWLKEAKQVKLGEEPYKFVKPRPSFRDIKNGVKITEATLPVYGLWQTEPYEPPKAKNGKVPRNAYGNVDLYQPQMLPKGCVHILDFAAGKVARRLNIDCAQAMVGWQFRSGASLPLFDGWVVCKEFEGALLKALEEYEEEEEQRAQAKVDKRVYGNWKKLIKGLLIRERLRLRYGKDSF